jgi:hypothetical protein
MDIYIKTSIYVRQIGDEFLLEKNLFEGICKWIQKRFFYISVFRYWIFGLIWDNVKKYGRDRYRKQDNIIQHIRVSCWLDKAIDS